MTPGGHVGASIVATYVIVNCVFKSEATPAILGLSALVGMLPDLDGVIPMIAKRQWVLREKLQHHRYVTHTPLFYLALALLLSLALPPQAVILFGALAFIHLLLDSWATDDGIMWLWPFSRRQLSLFPRNLHAGGLFGIRFYRQLVRHHQIVVPEVVFLLGGSILAFHALTLI